MEFEAKHDENSVQFNLSGSLTFTDNILFRSVLKIVDHNEIDTISIDFEKLTFIDSAGLGMLLMLRDLCNRQKKKLTLLNPTGQIEQVFHISKFDELFNVQKM